MLVSGTAVHEWCGAPRTIDSRTGAIAVSGPRDSRRPGWIVADQCEGAALGEGEGDGDEPWGVGDGDGRLATPTWMRAFTVA